MLILMKQSLLLMNSFIITLSLKRFRELGFRNDIKSVVTLETCTPDYIPVTLNDIISIYKTILLSCYLVYLVVSVRNCHSFFRKLKDVIENVAYS